MYNLYNQIQIKGLYFFCTRYNEKEKKNCMPFAGQNIQQSFLLKQNVSQINSNSTI